MRWLDGIIKSMDMILSGRSLEKEMATYSSVLAWRIPGTEEPGGLPSMGSHRVGSPQFFYLFVLTVVQAQGLGFANKK